MTKAIISFAAFLDADLSTVAGGILELMGQNAGTFPAPTPSLADIQALAKKIARAALEDGLRLLGTYVNGVAKGDALIVEQSGFPSYDTVNTPPPSIRPAPQNLRLKHGLLPGTVGARFQPFRNEDSQEVQAHAGDPNDEAGWTTKAIVRGGKATLDGLTPGALVWVRVRSLNASGQPGPWSAVENIRVL